MSEARASTNLHEQPSTDAAPVEDCGWEADDRAMRAAREAKACCEYARQVAERGQARLRELEQAQRHLRAEVDRETEAALREAVAAKRRARQRVKEAARKLIEARRLVDEAQAPASRSHDPSCWGQVTDRALELNGEAERQAVSRRPAGDQEWQLSGGSLGCRTRQELVVLAATLGVKKPTNLTKSQLVYDVTKASGDHRSAPGARRNGNRREEEHD